MSTKARLLLSGLLLILFLVMPVTADAGQSLTPIPVGDQQQVQPPAARAACTMTRSTNTIASYFSGFTIGMENITFFDPTGFCTSPVYPFEITDFSFTLLGFTGAVWPVVVDVVVYSAVDSCSGPGAELCRFTVTANQATYGFPTVGTASFPTPCCVNGPFYIGLEYVSGAAGSAPSICYDNNPPPDTCVNWFFYSPDWYEWYDIWTPPPPAYPMFWVTGETQSPNCPTVCDWQPGDPYKMHFPQLPNDSGWNVNATAPVALADDWKCSQTGWVKDIHFWGSWRNGIVGQIQYFVLSIASDIPAVPPQVPYSRPGQTLWEREITNFPFTPVDPPSLEGWYDPSIGEVLPNDHGSYFQYNICFDDSLDWFRQTKDSIYWLSISAVVQDPQATKWGWKSTLNHFNDDAVWAYWGELNWIDLWEPTQPDSNCFYAQVDPTGFLSGGGCDYFGQGWYFYPTNWWNIWFYDDPFTYDRGKVIRINLIVEKMIPATPSFIVFAVNWSTDRWSIEQPPQDSMPPLPGVPEQLYIGRDTLLVGQDLIGQYVFDYLIRDYNPEWVSVDVMGTNLNIQGRIKHACSPSLDLSFVITSDTLICDCIPGDANGNGFINIADVVYVIQYIFGGGPAPVPYAICSGDATCNCLVNIADAVYLIQYIFGGGPAPCNCQQWLINCGPPLRK